MLSRLWIKCDRLTHVIRGSQSPWPFCSSITFSLSCSMTTMSYLKHMWQPFVIMIFCYSNNPIMYCHSQYYAYYRNWMYLCNAYIISFDSNIRLAHYVLLHTTKCTIRNLSELDVKICQCGSQETFGFSLQWDSKFRFFVIIWCTTT